MQRSTKKRRKLGARAYKDYTEEMLDLALDMVEKNIMSSRDAEKQLGIPRRTILNKLKKRHMKPVGGQKKLSDEEEENFVKVLIAAGDFGSPMTKLDLKVLVGKYCEKNSLDIFHGKLPSDTWVRSFLERHASKLTNRTTQNIKKARAEKSLKEIENYFSNLSETLKDVPPENILNYDETNLSDNPGDTKCIFRRGIKYPERVLNTSKSCTSIMFTACAAGYCLPTYVVYKATHLYSEWVIGGPDGTRFNCTKSGWFNSVTFVDYFKTIVIEWARKLTGPKVIIGDNLSSHLNIEVIELCQEHNIRFVFLPPSSTHITQPLDVAFFAPLKKEWKNILLQYKLANPTQNTLNKKHFPKLLANLMENIKIKEKELVKSAFQATGIYPLNARRVFKKIPEYFAEKEYGVESLFIEYLKETRKPNPMEIKRTKKILTEPGKSVTPDDITVKPISQNIDNKPNSNTQLQVKNSKKNTRKKPDESSNKNKNKIDCSSNTLGDIATHTQDITMQEDIDMNEINQILDETTGELIHAKYTGRKNEEPIVYNPNSLKELCIKSINNWFRISTDDVNKNKVHTLQKTLKRDSQNIPFCVSSDDQLPKVLWSDKTNVNNVSASSSKVTIISNQKVDVKTISHRTKDKKKVTGAKVDSNALQMKLVAKKNKYPKTQAKKIKNQHVNTDTHTGKIYKPGVHTVKNKPQSNQKALKNKRAKNVIESSSEDDYDGYLSLANTESSDYEDYEKYVAEILNREDQEEKENQAPKIPFGISDINYLEIETADSFKQDDWIIVKFTTKRSVKHYVGQILHIKHSIPTVKFLRKVKNTKGNKFVFTYPHVEDICEITHEDDVLLVLPPPTISRRGQIMFDADLSSFNVQ